MRNDVHRRKRGDTDRALGRRRGVPPESTNRADARFADHDEAGPTTEPNDVVEPVHPKAMPVILTTPEEIETWMTAPAEDALQLQRALPDGTLRIVATGVKQDGEAA